MDIKRLKATRAKKRKMQILGVVGLLLLVVGFLLIIINPITIARRYRSRVAKGSDIYKLMQQKDSPGVTVAAYLLNVTNAEQFLAGKETTLKVEEVGPFTYLEQRSNEDLEINEETDRVYYTPRTHAKFLPEKSIADPNDVIVNMPNIAMLTMSSMMTEYPYITRLAFNMLLVHLNTKAIVRQTAQEFLWGYDEPLIKLGNNVLPGWISFDTLGILDRMYDQNVEYRLEVATNIEDRFKIKSMNGIPGLKTWEYEDPSHRTKCNTFADAYEGIGYPVDLSPGAPLKIFRNVLCRFLPMEYQGMKTMEDGVQGLKYKFRDDNFKINNDTQCLCTRGTCIDGISDLSPCFYKLPLAISYAHFLYGNSSLLDRIEGLKPDEEKHGSNIIIEPKLGMVLETSFSVQVNVVVKKIDFNKQAARFNDMVVPLCWFKLEQPELIEKNKNNLKLLYVIAPYSVWGSVAVMILIGFVLLGYSFHIFISDWIYSRSIIFQPPEAGKTPGLPAAVPLLSSS